MQNQILSKAMKHWAYIAPLATYPKNAKEFDKLVFYLDQLLDIVGDNEDHPLIGLVDILSHLIDAYEEQHKEKAAAKGIDALIYLMKAHNLQQSDLSEVGSQGVISEILNGKRSLNLRQIKRLAERFHVDPATFLD